MGIASDASAVACNGASLPKQEPALWHDQGGRGQRVSLDGRQIDLTPTELSILEMLIRYKGQVVTRTMLCEHIWGFRWDGPTNVIEVHITRIRGKLDAGREQSLTRTIRGRGYALAAD